MCVWIIVNNSSIEIKKNCTQETISYLLQILCKHLKRKEKGNRCIFL